LLYLKAAMVLAVVVPVSVFCIAAWQDYEWRIGRAEEHASHLTRLLEEHTSKAFEAIELVVRRADDRIKGLDDETIRSSRTLWDELVALQQVGEQVGSIFVLNRTGENLLSTRAFPPAPLDFSDRDYFREQAVADRGFFVGGTYTGKISQQPIFNFSIRRSDADGRFNGVVGSSAFVSYFENFYAHAGPAADRFAISLVRDDGTILVRYPRLKNEAHFLSDSPIVSNVGQSEGIFYAPSVVDGRQHLYSFGKVGRFPVSVVYELDLKSATAEWRRAFIGWGVVTVFVSLSLLLTLWFALHRARAEEAAVVSWHHAEKANEEREALFREVAHRVQNNLQLLISMLSVERRMARGTDPDRLLGSVIERVRTMARLHSALFQRGTSGSVYTDEFFAQFGSDLRTGVIGGEPIFLVLDVTRTQIRLDHAVTLGLIVNELVTNAVKYAFKERPSGEIRISFVRENKDFVLTVTDNGTGFEEASPAGFGAKLLRVLASQLGGQLHVRSEQSRGSTVSVKFPAREP
jgi:two-component sensor histidine kinase